MRNENDIVRLTFSLEGSIELDLERIETDPIWQTITRNQNLEDLEMRKFLLETYVVRYLCSEELLKRVPSTNGPADIYATNAVLKEAHGDNAQSSC